MIKNVSKMVFISLVINFFVQSGVVAISDVRCVPEWYKMMQDAVSVSHEDLKYVFWPSYQQNPIPITMKNLTKVKVPHRSLKVITHGWKGSIAPNTPWVQKLVDTYLKSKKVSVLAIDWSSCSCYNVYPQAALYTVPVGKKISEFLQEMDKKLGIKLENMHFIGHSLGGQVAGYTGKNIKLATKGRRRIGRISGLDPAGPGFQNCPNDTVLNRGDAHFVDVVHTDIIKFGIAGDRGTVDFYPNGGLDQPGCPIFCSTEKESTRRIFAEYDFQDSCEPLGSVWDIGCGHARSVEYWLESVNSKKFIGQKCKDIWTYEKGLCRKNEKQIMGEHVSCKAKNPPFFLTTNAATPYARNDKP